MAKRKVLILGGNGFIGSNLSTYLAEMGDEVYSFDMVYPQVKDERIHYIQGDFFDDNTLREIVKGMDVIFHAISTVNPGNSNEKYMMGYSRDFIQTVKLCSLLVNTNSVMIFLSSGGTVYGKQDIQPISENAVARPINHYGNIKLCIENTIRIFNIQSDSKMRVARISNPYGPGQDFTKGVGFVDAVIKRTIENSEIEIWGDGNIVRDYIYIADVCKMLYELSIYDGEEEIFNISSGVGVSQNDIIKMVDEIIGGAKYCYKPGRSVDVNCIILNNEKMMQIYNKELVSIKEGIRLYYNYLMEKIGV
ncbi:MAG: NAD-dependent epimerase/dehydratase family protein [Eubacterium sp.]|nr:NAD-dependent epimerase/dehydratase family protein [Eubacterium sp.]